VSERWGVYTESTEREGGGGEWGGGGGGWGGGGGGGGGGGRRRDLNTSVETVQLKGRGLCTPLCN